MARKRKKLADALIEADGAVAEAVEPLAETPAVEAAGWLSEIGDQPPMRALCLGLLGAGLVARSPRLTRAGARMIAAHSLATFAKDAVKARVDRTRPRTDKDHKPRPGRHKHKEMTSFPSGHSAGAAAAALAYAREFPEHKGAALAGAGAVALAQIPRCAHYPTDVGSGLLIGWLSELAVDRLVDALQLSGDDPEA